MAEIKNKYPYGGRFLSVIEISDITGMKKKTIWKRIWRARKKGKYTVSQDLFNPKDMRGLKVEIFSDEGIPIIEIAQQKGLPYHTVLTRYYAGYRSAAALGAKVMGK